MIEGADAKTQQATSTFAPQRGGANKDQEKLMRLIRQKRRRTNTDRKWKLKRKLQATNNDMT